MVRPDERAVVLVEGLSDQRAVTALALRLGRDLTAERVSVVAMGGATNIDAYLAELLARQPSVSVAGLVDEAQAPVFRRALRRLGRPDDLEAAGFFVCVEDLEDELIRALGVEQVLAILTAEGDGLSYDRFRQQPAQRDRAEVARLRRFLGTRSGRKIHYGGVLVAGLEADRVPTPLAHLMSRV